MTEGLAEVVGRLLSERRLTLAVAEASCCGLICHLITNVPGSSRYFVGGVVAYHAGPKERILGVPAPVLKQHGSVSAETALAMARGVAEALGADIGLAETGIAGPTGGTAAKPAGMFFIAVASKDGRSEVREVRWGTGDRVGNKERTAQAALELVRGFVEG
jgi:PncC family amidohydrolase